MNKNDIQNFHRLEKADPVARFVNRKFYYEVLNFRKVDSTKLGFQAGVVGNSKEQTKLTVVGVPKGL